jgi:hypothetical protein
MYKYQYYVNFEILFIIYFVNSNDYKRIKKYQPKSLQLSY